MRRLLIIAVLTVLAVLGLWRWLRTERANTWDIRNLPIADGPILCFGDSLVEGVGASAESETYPAQLGRLLGREVQAHGVSGLTAAEGRQALREALDLRAPLAVVTLGGNDLLRRIPLGETRSALDDVFAELQARGGVVVYTEVLGVVPGERAKMHRAICRKRGVILVPDVMDGILRNDDLLADSIHPNDEGYALIARRIAAVLTPYLDPVRNGAGGGRRD